MTGHDQGDSAQNAAPPGAEAPGGLRFDPGALGDDLLSGRELHRALELAGVAMAVGQPGAARILGVNREFCELTGYAATELLERTFFDITHPDDRARDMALYAAAMRGDVREWRSEKRYVRKDGGVRWVVVRGAMFKDERGKAVRSVGVIHDITDRKLAEQALLEGDRRKDEFLAMLAHELRNPLSAMQFALSVSQLPAVPEPRRAWAQGVMQRQLRQLGRMVDDLLDVSRITRGKITLEKEPLDLGHVIQQAVAACAPMIDAASHALAIDVGPRPLSVFGDGARLEQVVVNLLANAAKYTREGGRISLAAGREGAEIVLRVKDTGFGIPAQRLPRIFDLFEQAHPALDRSRGGLGIGLTLVKRLVELHGGAVSAASEGEGRGSEFTVRLPAADAPERREEAAAPRRGVSPRRILVVDDDRDHALGLAFVLEQAGHTTAVAHDGASALEVARCFGPEVVVLDIGLPGIDGHEVARQLREAPGAAALRIVALSGYGQPDDQRRSREAGCDAHLIKPVTPEALLDQVASAAPGEVSA